MNQEIAKRESTAIANTPQNAPVPLMRGDIIVPYVVLAQGTSDSVKERRAQLGDIVRSTNAEKLGDPDTPLDVIFLHCPRPEWVIEQKEAGKDRYKFRGTMARNAANETLPWNYWADDDGNEMPPASKGATEWRRVKRLSVFGVLPKDVEAAQLELKKVSDGELPDPNKALTPVLFSFRSSSYKAGKEICTFFSKAQSMKVPIWWYQLRMSDFLDKNDEGSFYVWKADANITKGIPKEWRPQIEEWVNLLNAGVQFKVDDEAESETLEKTVDAKVTDEAKNEVC